MAQLRTISYSQLMVADTLAMKDLEDAATLHGVFYLDFKGSQIPRIFRDGDDCLEAVGNFFSLPLEKKLEYDIDRIGTHRLNGYKPEGRNARIDNGKQDGFEAYYVPHHWRRNPLVEGEKVALPGPLDAQRSLLERLMSDLHKVGASILRSLSLVLRLPIEQSLESSHRHHLPSTSALGTLKYPQPSTGYPQLVSHNTHTDIGSLTLLFCPEPGLQILDPNTHQWASVEPKKDHAVVNVGDSLRLLSGRRLRSCLHRVVLPMEAKMTDRYSFAYFLRPELDAVIVDEKGKAWRSIDWHEEKFKRFRASVENQQQDSFSTGEAGS